ncbi:hypothetical protein Zmor_011999 [Zophobas morio]|uniref:Uncharacterized protein n=1 Tax=Zophobas morio TaxID=2755281 RepID=A0AA38LZN4_9CUCU|nr:hypothetical protein Zmor_011999 [Zophobas morio]
MCVCHHTQQQFVALGEYRCYWRGIEGPSNRFVRYVYYWLNAIHIQLPFVVPLRKEAVLILATTKSTRCRYEKLLLMTTPKYFACSNRDLHPIQLTSFLLLVAFSATSHLRYSRQAPPDSAAEAGTAVRGTWTTNKRLFYWRIGRLSCEN